MYAIEFETDIKNNSIRLPENCMDLREKHVKVILLVKEKESKQTKENIKQFLSRTVKVANFIMPDRDVRNAK
jgi:hypothetical protein